ncbi:MAG TPA: hypothetical protein VKM55_01875 [Candidatus Lokiarchaeia archaeon]|nr:hypothetical protein [Candidatus Lokiarchaeia archaeon]
MSPVILAESKERPDLALHDEYPVLQLTTTGDLNMCQYFTHRSWTMDEKRLFFISNRHRGMELFFVDMTGGEIVQCSSDGNVFMHAWALAPDDRSIIYAGGARQDEFHQVDLVSFEDRIVARIPEHFAGFAPSIIDICPDNDTFYMCAIKRPDLVPSNLLVGSIATGSVTPFFSPEDEAGNFFDHQMLAPGSSTLLQINKTPRAEMGGDAPQRMWLLNVENRVLKPVYKQKKGRFHAFERACHESWLPDGKHLCFVVRRDKVKVVSIDGDFGKETSWCAGQGPNFWHVSANPAWPMLAADTSWKDSGIWLIELVPGKKGRMFNLCLSRSEWQDPAWSSIQKLAWYPLQSHPHPGWSPSGRYLQFTSFSAAEKAVHVYLVDVQQSPFNND